MFTHFLKLVFPLLLAAGLVVGETESDAYFTSLQHHGYVNDFAGVLSVPEKQQLEALLQQLERKTGAELAVVAVDSMRGGEVHDVANRLFERWGIGKKGKDNGILLFAAIQEHKAAIEVGYGLEPVIPDAQAGRILDQAVMPWFKPGQTGQALMNGAFSIARRVADASDVTLEAGALSGTPRQGSARQSGKLSWLHILFIILLIPVILRNPWLLLFFLSGGRGGGFSGGGFGGGGFGGGFGGGLSGGGGASR